MVYPPGIPIFIPGEIITEENIPYLRKTRLLASSLTEEFQEAELRFADEHSHCRKPYNIEVELSDLYNILCIFTPGDRAGDADRLVSALRMTSVFA
jgi:arginine/lysine/ornithine decarboxylase